MWQVADAYQMATQLDPGDYKAWHSWALVNFRMVEQVSSDSFASFECLKVRAWLLSFEIVQTRG
jgi:hypothetical protein